MEHGQGWDGEKPFELSCLCLCSAGLASFRGKQTGTHREGSLGLFGLTLSQAFLKR